MDNDSRSRRAHRKRVLEDKRRQHRLPVYHVPAPGQSLDPESSRLRRAERQRVLEDMLRQFTASHHPTSTTAASLASDDDAPDSAGKKRHQHT